jgi:hypothetical protein
MIELELVDGNCDTANCDTWWLVCLACSSGDEALEPDGAAQGRRAEGAARHAEEGGARRAREG